MNLHELVKKLPFVKTKKKEAKDEFKECFMYCCISRLYYILYYCLPALSLFHISPRMRRFCQQLMNCQLLLILAAEQFLVTNNKRSRKEETTFFGDLILRNVEILNENIPNLLLFTFYSKRFLVPSNLNHLAESPAFNFLFNVASRVAILLPLYSIWLDESPINV